jgi:hypothetical protein
MLLALCPVRYVLLGIVLILATASPARADSGLTDAVVDAYFPRFADERLHAIAHERVAELLACHCLEHDRMRPGTAEVLYTLTLGTDPIGSALRSWADSPLHHAILSDRSYGRIGCAVTAAGDTHWVACVLAEGPLPQPGGFVLPDTALASPSVGFGGALVRPI